MNERQLLMKHLQANVEAIHPGKGKAQAALIRETCDCLGLDEDEWLPRWVTRDKQAWGLKGDEVGRVVSEGPPSD